MATKGDKRSEAQRKSGSEVEYTGQDPPGKEPTEPNSEGGFVRTQGNKLTYNPLSIDEFPQPSPEQERLFEINIDNGVAQRLKEARAIGPSVRQQTQADILNLVLMAKELGGNPFSVRRLPFSIMRDMAADPNVAFALYYIETPLINAQWSLESPDAQLAAAVDSALRPINSDLISKFCQAITMGYQPMVKRFKLGKLDGVYRDKTSENPDKDLPVWPSKNVDALLWKTFLALPPENCLPRWNEMGNFNGYMYSPVPIPNPLMLGVAQTYGPQVLSGYPIPLEWSMWVVNERHKVNGSLYGQPRTRRAYRFWWSFWFRWALADRSYENKADPAKIIYFPTQVADALDANNTESETPHNLQQKAIQTGNSIRSGTTVAFPGDFMVNEEGKTMNQRAWDAKYMEGGENFSSLEQNFMALATSIIKCVTADTPVDCPRNHLKYPDGIPISELKAGDYVWTFNTDKLEFQLHPIKGACCTLKDQKVYKLGLSNGKYIRCTDEHPFLKSDLSWCKLKDLKINDALLEFRRDYEPYIKLKVDGHAFNMEYKIISKQIGLKNYMNLDEKKVHIHHKDTFHYNTDINNLEAISINDHMSLNRKDKIRSAETREKISKARIKHTEERAILTKAALNSDDDLLLEEREYYIENGFRGSQQNKMYKIKNCVLCKRKFAPTQGGEQRHCQACRYDNKLKENRTRRSRINWNATETPGFEDLCDKVYVTYIEEDKVEDVWDISIDGPDSCRNFVTNNIVAHNSMFLPEQAFVDATMAGQTSSQRYISAQMGEIYQESQQQLSNEYDEYINKYMIPEFIAANFPDKIDTPCKRVTRGYGARNSETTKQIITLLGQKNPENLPIDIRQLLREEGYPLTSEAQQKLNEKKHQEAVENAKPPVMVPQKKEGMAGANAGVEKTEAGEHVYFQPGEELFLGVNTLTGSAGREAGSFVDTLPKIPPYEDAAVRTAAVQMRKTFMDRYRHQITSLANQIRNKTILKLAQPEESLPSKPGLGAGAARAAASGAVAAWLSDQGLTLPATSKRLKEILGRIVAQAGKRELKLANLDPNVYDPSSTSKWVDSYVDENLQLMDNTTHDVFRDFLEKQLQQNSHPDTVAQSLEDHFADMPSTYAARAVRAQTRDAYNEGMLQAAEDAGIDQVLAHDASSGTNLNTDPKCINRNGKVFSIKDAKKEIEHPNGTLFFTYLTTSNLSVKITDDIPDSLELTGNMQAGYDNNTETLYIKNGAKGSEKKYLLALSERLKY